MAFKVLTLMTSGWEDCWGEEDADGNRTPTRFDTEAEAEAEIQDALPYSMDMTREDFLIVSEDTNPAHLAVPR